MPYRWPLTTMPTVIHIRRSYYRSLIDRVVAFSTASIGQQEAYMRPFSNESRSSTLTFFKMRHAVTEANEENPVLSVLEQPASPQPGSDTSLVLAPTPSIQMPVARIRRRRTKLRAIPVPAPPEQFDPATERLAEPAEECTVCRSTVFSMPLDSPTSLCTHPASVCRKCLVLIIENGIAGSIRCPTDECRQELGYADVVKWTRASKEELAIFDRYADRSHLLKVIIRTTDKSTKIRQCFATCSSRL
jgi:hypothetical protein